MDVINKQFHPPLDAGIEKIVLVLSELGVETFESCQGGEGHPCPEPFVRFHGDKGEGLRALSVAIQHNLNPAYLRRTWPIQDGEITGPYWELVFTLKD